MLEDVVQRPVVGRLFEAGLARHLEAEVCGQPLDRPGKLRRSYSIRKLSAEPRAPQPEAMVELPLTGLTVNDGVFSLWNGQQAWNSRPAFFSGTRRPTISTIYQPERAVHR